MSRRPATACALAVAALVIAAGSGGARAQSATTGAVQGVVRDRASHEPLAGVAVVVSAAAQPGTVTAFSDDRGYFKVTGLAPGAYVVTFYYLDARVARRVAVDARHVTAVYQALRSDAVGEVVTVEGAPPLIDPSSTSQGVTLDRDDLRDLPLPGRSFEGALGVAPGARPDGVGIAFSGSTSLENRYVIDGNDTTGLRYGDTGTALAPDFLDTVEVITGGYDAEYGRATGGIVNAVTRSGGNHTHGSVFAYETPGWVSAAGEPTPSQTTFFSASRHVRHDLDVGFELGGPLVRDHLWYYLGVQPALTLVDVRRNIDSRTDCRALGADGALTACSPEHADGRPDTDPRTGRYLTDRLDSRRVAQHQARLAALGKLDLQLRPEHRGQLSLIAQPYRSRGGSVFGLPSATALDGRGLTTDAALRWTSTFDDHRTEVEAVLGWHRASAHLGAADAAADALPAQVLTHGSLGSWARYLGESQRVVDGCSDGSSVDRYPGIVNCPDEGSVGYQVGGPGRLVDDVEDRLAAKLSAIRRVRFLGGHEWKAGVDAERDQASSARRYSGGAWYLNEVGAHRIVGERWVQIDDRPDAGPRFDDRCGDTAFGEARSCDYLGGAAGYPGTQVDSATVDWATYLRDSWRILPELTINAGVRYEAQRLRYARGLQGTVDPLTGRARGDDALVLRGMFAPRVGILYDWTHEGRAKLYAHAGRYYESIPLDINDRLFGGEVQYRQTWDADGGACGAADPRIGGPDAAACTGRAVHESLLGSSGVTVAPGIRAQYLDEVVAGVELALPADVAVGIAFQRRWLGRVIEDVSTDGGRSYLVANPGEWSSAEEARLSAQLAAASDDAERARLAADLASFRGLRRFDRPRRDYQALQVTLARRVARLSVQASYTYARVRGNYPGLVSYDNGQIDPNISSQYDLIELLANRGGPLPQDRPHALALDGAYRFRVGRGELVTGARARSMSGAPREALASHYRYGADEAFLLPRGRVGRTGFEHAVDLHLAYRRDLGRGLALDVFCDLFNVYDHQGSFQVDDRYGADDGHNFANPIVGGSYEDLIWAKSLDADGAEPVGGRPPPLRRNPNFGNTTARYQPFSARFGARLEF